MNQILVSEKLYITPELKRKKRMYKIDTVSLFYIGKQRRFLLKNQRIPTDVGNLILCRDHIPDGPDFAFEQAQTLVTAILEAALKQQLHTKADAH